MKSFKNEPRVRTGRGLSAAARKRLYRPPADDEPLDEIQLALVRALAPIIAEKIREELVAEAAAKKETPPTTETKTATTPAARPRSPWLTAQEAADRLRINVKLVYYEVGAGRLRAARVGGRRSLRLLPEWCDQYLEQSTTPVEVKRQKGGK